MDGYLKRKDGFTLIELLVVIAIIAVLAVVVILTLNPGQLLMQSRDANRISDISNLADALNLYTADQSGASGFSLGNASNTSASIWDPSATSTAGDQCQGLNMLSFGTSTGQAWQCAASSSYRSVNGTGWVPVNFNAISTGAPLGSLPVDPINQTSSGLFYAYNTNGIQFEVTATLESTKYRSAYANSPDTPFFPAVISGGTPTVSALYSPTGLVGYWTLNEGGGGTTAYDTSGNGNSGTWNGSMTGGSYYTTGLVESNAGNFNGTNDYISIPNQAYTNVMSVVAWIQTPSTWATSGGGQFFVSRRNNNEWSVFVNNGPGSTVQFNGWQSGGSTIFAVTSQTALSTGTWYQIAAVTNGTTATMYVNGVANGTPQPVTGTIANFGKESIAIGRCSQAGVCASEAQRYWNGAIQDVRIYSRALSAAEVMALYNAEK